MQCLNFFFSPAVMECPHEFIGPFQESCYAVSNFKVKNQQMAQKMCNGLESNLLAIESEEENIFLIHNIPTHKGTTKS